MTVSQIADPHVVRGDREVRPPKAAARLEQVAHGAVERLLRVEALVHDLELAQ